MTDDLPLLGFGLPIAGPWATPDVVAVIASRAEALGYASLWTFQRVLYPLAGGLDRGGLGAGGLDRGGLGGGRLAGGLGPAHRAVHDPVVTLAYVAGMTGRIGLGTATLCAPFTPPAVLAKALTSLDVMSAGRLTVGLGMGWLRQEYAAAGVPFERRGARLEEYLRCLEEIWTGDPVQFAGDFYTVPRSQVAPAPVQRPHPPILLGGGAAAALRRAGRLAQGWIGSSEQDLARIGRSVETVRDGARQAGRDPDALRIVLRAVPELLDTDPGRPRRPLHGTRSQVLDDLVRLRAQGVTEVFLDLNLSPRVGFPGVDTGAAVDYAERVLDAFAHQGR